MAASPAQSRFRQHSAAARLAASRLRRMGRNIVPSPLSERRPKSFRPRNRFRWRRLARRRDGGPANPGEKDSFAHHRWDRQHRHESPARIYSIQIARPQTHRSSRRPLPRIPSARSHALNRVPLSHHARARPMQASAARPSAAWSLSTPHWRRREFSASCSSKARPCL